MRQSQLEVGIGVYLDELPETSSGVSSEDLSKTSRPRGGGWDDGKVTDVLGLQGGFCVDGNIPSLLASWEDSL